LLFSFCLPALLTDFKRWIEARPIVSLPGGLTREEKDGIFEILPVSHAVPGNHILKNEARVKIWFEKCIGDPERAEELAYHVMEDFSSCFGKPHSLLFLRW
jgi:hypothetical protein